MKGCRWFGRFLYALAWPLGLCYAFLFGQSWHPCMSGRHDPFGWAFFLSIFVAIGFWPATAAAVGGSAIAASCVRSADSAAWRRRLAWLAGALLAVALVGGVAFSGVIDNGCYLKIM